MYSLRKPQWVFLVNTVPVLVLLALCYGEFSVVRTLLPPESVAQWQRFGAALALLAVGGAGYAGRQWARRQPLSAWYSLAVLVAYSLLLCWFTGNSNEVLPWSVPAWMVPTPPVVLAWTLLMPTLAHAMLALVAKFTPEDHNQSALANIVFAAAVPIVWALVYMVLSAIAGLFPWPELGSVVFVTAMVASTLGFFFFLVRAVFVMTMRKAGMWADIGPLWKGLLTIVLPLVGLAVNNGVISSLSFRQDGGIFGNFTSPWFYVLAVLNGVLLCVPSSSRPLPRLLLLLGRSALFGYTFYFFLVFLPFLPLSIPAIILIGTGFLIMTPVLLFVVHVRQLSEDVAVVRALFSKAVAVAALVAGLAALPLYFTFSYWHSRRTLHAALAYVYTPNYAAANAEAACVDADALVRTLAVLKQHKGRNRDFLSGGQLPYLSTYFNWLVLDNLMLSDSKVADLERVFLGTPVPQAVPAPVFVSRRAGNSAPALQGLSASSTYDARQQAWVSWVNLELANTDATEPDGEYATSFALPPGCWVSDYYLTIGNRQERGILAEEKAATWVFAQIRNEHQSRDPGLLHYVGPDQVALRVYPVVRDEPRRTRVQLLHKEPFVLTVDGRTVELGDSATAPPVATPVRTPGNGVVYLSALAKKSLPLVQRRPYYHFLLDASAGATAEQYRGRIARQLAQPLSNGAPARFSLVNAYTTPVPATAGWEQALSAQPREGGFFLTGAIRRVLFDAQQHPGPTYPVLVVVTDNMANAVLDPDFADFSSAYPESDVFYELAADGQPVPHSLRRASAQALAAAAPLAAAPVRAWPSAAQPSAYLPDNDEAAIVSGQVLPTLQPEVVSRRWLAGLMLRGYGQWQSFHPETTDRERVPYIQASFRAGIMTPFTSFLALENDAQKAALYRKQEQTLAANASLDTLEDNELQQPTETPIDSGVLVLLVGGGLLAGWYLRRGAPLPT